MNLILRFTTMSILFAASLGCTGENNGNPALPEAKPPMDVFKREVTSVLNDIEEMVDSNGIAAFAESAELMEEGMGSLRPPAGGPTAGDVDTIMSDLKKLLSRADTYSKKEVYDEIDAIKAKVDAL